MVILSACSSTSTTHNSTSVQDVIDSVHEEVIDAPSSVSLDKGDIKICDDYTYKHHDECVAVESRNMDLCKTLSRDRDIQECMIEIAKQSSSSSKISGCDFFKDVSGFYNSCRALFKEDQSSCYSIEKSLYSSTEMRDCVTNVAIKTKDVSVCDDFVTKSSSFVATCFGDESSCETKWSGDAAQKQKSTCVDAVNKGFEPMFTYLEDNVLYTY